MRNQVAARLLGAASLAAALLAAAVPALAALPPYWQRAREVQAIIESSEIARLLKENPVDGIEWREVDLYSVRAGTCRVDVRIVDLPQAMQGARRFRIEPGPVHCH